MAVRVAMVSKASPNLKLNYVDQVRLAEMT